MWTKRKRTAFFLQLFSSNRKTLNCKRLYKDITELSKSKDFPFQRERGSSSSCCADGFLTCLCCCLVPSFASLPHFPKVHIDRRCTTVSHSSRKKEAQEETIITQRCRVCLILMPSRESSKDRLVYSQSGYGYPHHAAVFETPVCIYLTKWCNWQ